MWWEAVKFGGDSGAMRQVSDIGPGFGRVPSTAGSRCCHGIGVKGYICECDPHAGRFRGGLAAVAAASRHRPDAQGRRAIRFASADSYARVLPRDDRVPGEHSETRDPGVPKRFARKILAVWHWSRLALAGETWISSRQRALAWPGHASGAPRNDGIDLTTPRHFKTRSTCRTSLKGTAEWSTPLPADWPSPLTV